MNINQMNNLVLAYLGDVVFELHIREYHIRKDINKVNDLQSKVVPIVCAKNQALLFDYLLENNLLSDDENLIMHRGRNASSKSRAKNTDINTYKKATGFECLIGYLYLEKKERLDFILNKVKEVIEC